MTMNISSSQQNHTNAYLDVKSLESIKNLEKNNKRLALNEAAKEFEAILINMMLKNMRSTNSSLAKDNYLGSEKINFYQGMLDDQWAVTFSQNGGLGFANSIVRQFEVDVKTNKTSDPLSVLTSTIEDELLVSNIQNSIE